MFSINLFFIVAAICAPLADAHTVVTYPGWRGDNLIVNASFPFGMQWSYPCGGVPPSSNRTSWPINGGGIAIQPGWFTGHKTALFYINLGLGTDGPDGGPPNTSFTMVPAFQITGPTNNPYPGTFCLPQVPLPSGISVNVGDKATIQVVETTAQGNALYNCVDITFAELDDVPPLNASNCFNSTTITFSDPFAATASTSSSSTKSACAASTVPPSQTTCSPCPTCPTQTSCPKTNGDSGLAQENVKLGVGFSFGVLAIRMFGL